MPSLPLRLSSGLSLFVYCCTWSALDQRQPQITRDRGPHAYPADTLRNNNVIITPKPTLQRRFGVIMTLLLCHVFAGIWVVIIWNRHSHPPSFYTENQKSSRCQLSRFCRLHWLPSRHPTVPPVTKELTGVTSDKKVAWHHHNSWFSVLSNNSDRPAVMKGGMI